MIRFTVAGRQIQQHNSVLGMQGESDVECVEFVLPGAINGIDLASNGTAYLLYQMKSGKSNASLIRQEDITREEDKLILKWLVGSEATEEPGPLIVQIKICGISQALWKSELTTFKIGRSLQVETPQPQLRSRAASSSAPRIASPDTEPPITVAQRKMVIPAELKNISVQGDENAETVTIILPRYFDGADLSTKAIILKTVSKGGRDDIPFLKPMITDKAITMFWTLKPPQTSFDGELKIQLRVYGLVSTMDNRPYVWQTEQASVNIITSLDGAPVIPATPSIMEDFLKQIAQIAANAKASEVNAAQSAESSAESAADSADSAKRSASSAKQSEQARKDTEAIKNETQSIKDDTNQLKNLAQLSEANAKISADKAAVSESTAKTYRDESEGYAQIAQESAENVAASAAAALASETAARDEADRAKREADRSEREADRSEDAANRAHNLANAIFINPLNAQVEPLQQVLDSTFHYLYGLIRRLHQLGLSWADIQSTHKTWGQIQALGFTWREISILGINEEKVRAFAKYMAGGRM